MVGRTPEYVGKKIEAREVKMAMLAILILPLMMLGWTAIAVIYEPAVASIGNAGPHGFSEVLYAFTSQAANNGSAFADHRRVHAGGTAGHGPGGGGGEVVGFHRAGPLCFVVVDMLGRGVILKSMLA